MAKKKTVKRRQATPVKKVRKSKVAVKKVTGDIDTANIYVTNKEKSKRWVAVSKGIDGGGQTQYFGINPGKDEKWKRFRGSKLKFKGSKTANDSGRYVTGTGYVDAFAFPRDHKYQLKNGTMSGGPVGPKTATKKRKKVVLKKKSAKTKKVTAKE